MMLSSKFVHCNRPCREPDHVRGYGAGHDGSGPMLTPALLAAPLHEGHPRMAICWVVFDIGGIFEIIPGGGDPMLRFPQMRARWETRLGMRKGNSPGSSKR